MKPALSEEQRELLLQVVDGDLSGDHSERKLAAARELLRGNSEARAFIRTVGEQAVLIADIERMSQENKPQLLRTNTAHRVRDRRLLSSLAIALSLLAATASGWILQSYSSSDQLVARVTGVNGAILWTGDSGQIVMDLQLGQKLTGGTLEGMTPDAWVEITFNDDTQVSISGDSRVTFSDLIQKELHVHAGMVSANVRKQPRDKPMLVHTNTATFEVLGTQLRIESELTSSTLSVIEGAVKATRLFDNQSVEVPAQHRVIAAFDQNLRPEKLPDAIENWTSDLLKGRIGNYGRWHAASDNKPASLGSIPFNFRMPNGHVLNLFVAAFEPTYGHESPIKIVSTSGLRLRAQMKSPQHLFCGVTMRQSNGQFAGKFLLMHEASQFDANAVFDLEMRFADFQLDSTLESLKRDLPTAPTDLYIENIWIHTLEQNAGLEIYEVSVSANAAK